MNSRADKQARNEHRSAGRFSNEERRHSSAMEFQDSRSESRAQRALQAVADGSLGVRRQQAFHSLANNRERQAPIVRKASTTRGDTAQRASVPGVAGYGNFVDLGNGEFGTTKPTDLHEVAGLVNTIRSTAAANGKHQNIKVLTGTHGDKSGNLYGEGKFYTEDLAHEGHEKSEGGWINVLNVKGKSKDTVRGWMTPGASAVVLAWCYSKSSEENWNSVGADWANF